MQREKIIDKNDAVNNFNSGASGQRNLDAFL